MRPEWLRARLHGRKHLRVFCGKLIVITLEGRYVWAAVDDLALDNDIRRLRSWCWDEEGSRPKDAKGQSYPRYARPRSRNGFYDAAKDPEGAEWRTIERAHHTFLRQVVERGLAPDPRTKSAPGLIDEIATWGLLDPDVAFDLAVRDSLRLDREARRARLEKTPPHPPVRTAKVQVFDRSPDVVAVCSGPGAHVSFAGARRRSGGLQTELHILKYITGFASRKAAMTLLTTPSQCAQTATANNISDDDEGWPPNSGVHPDAEVRVLPKSAGYARRRRRRRR